MCSGRGADLRAVRIVAGVVTDAEQARARVVNLGTDAGFVVTNWEAVSGRA